MRFCAKVAGIGKKIAIKNLKDQNLSLSSLADTAVSLANVYAKSTKLISSCYSIKNANNVSKYDSQSEKNEPERS